jgi:hypothetical protein
LARTTERIAAYIGDEKPNGAPALQLTERSALIKKRRRSKQTVSFQDRLSEFVADERSKADAAAGCADRYDLVKKIRKAETAAISTDGRACPDRRLK